MRFIGEVVLSHKLIDTKSLPSTLIFTYSHFAHPPLQFPELEKRLPRVRKPWMSEDERMSIFDAVALAIAHSQAYGTRKHVS